MLEKAEDRLSSLVYDIESGKNLVGVCSHLEAAQKAYLRHIDYCKGLKSKRVESDPNTCEIAGPDGRCPGAPPVQTNPTPTGPQKFIHWGKVKRDSSASGR